MLFLCLFLPFLPCPLLPLPPSHFSSRPTLPSPLRHDRSRRRSCCLYLSFKSLLPSLLQLSDGAHYPVTFLTCLVLLVTFDNLYVCLRWWGWLFPPSGELWENVHTSIPHLRLKKVEVEISSRTLIPFFVSGAVHSGSAS